jgi:hypothetical protein
MEEKSHETHDENHSDLSDDTISEESDYEKQKAKRARKARPPRSHSPKPKSNESKSNERPKRNKATTRLQHYNADRSTRDQRTIERKMKKPTPTTPDLPLQNLEQSANSAANQKCPDSTSSKISTPDPYLPYDTMPPTTLMEELCSKEREHWKASMRF